MRMGPCVFEMIFHFLVPIANNAKSTATLSELTKTVTAIKKTAIKAATKIANKKRLLLNNCNTK